MVDSNKEDNFIPVLKPLKLINDNGCGYVFVLILEGTLLLLNPKTAHELSLFQNVKSEVVIISI